MPYPYIKSQYGQVNILIPSVDSKKKKKKNTCCIPFKEVYTVYR